MAETTTEYRVEYHGPNYEESVVITFQVENGGVWPVSYPTQEEVADAVMTFLDTYPAAPHSKTRHYVGSEPYVPIP